MFKSNGSKKNLLIWHSKIFVIPIILFYQYKITEHFDKKQVFGWQNLLKLNSKSKEKQNRPRLHIKR